MLLAYCSPLVDQLKNTSALAEGTEIWLRAQLNDPQSLVSKKLKEAQLNAAVALRVLEVAASHASEIQQGTFVEEDFDDAVPQQALASPSNSEIERAEEGVTSEVAHQLHVIRTQITALKEEWVNTIATSFNAIDKDKRVTQKEEARLAKAYVDQVVEHSTAHRQATPEARAVVCKTLPMATPDQVATYSIRLDSLNCADLFAQLSGLLKQEITLVMASRSYANGNDSFSPAAKSAYFHRVKSGIPTTSRNTDSMVQAEEARSERRSPIPFEQPPRGSKYLTEEQRRQEFQQVIKLTK